MKMPATLPKAKLFKVELRPAVWRLMPFAWFRMANSGRLYLGPLMISWRMPWLPDVARRLHPECFSAGQAK